MLANRVRKNAKHLRKWAKRTSVLCYRLYDRDIPEVPLAIDWYDGRLYIAAYVRHQKPGEDTPDGWLEAMVSSVREVLEVPHENVYLKQRSRQRGKSQYERIARSKQRFYVDSFLLLCCSKFHGSVHAIWFHEMSAIFLHPLIFPSSP